MKRIFALALLVAVPLIPAASSDDRIAYEKALALEEANGRLTEAIALFQKVVRSSSDEALAAQAQLHVGICYEKLARREARAAYQAVLERYPDQRDAVRTARDRLARLAAAANPARTTTVREFARTTAPSVDKLAEPVEDAGEFVVSADGQTFVYTDWNTGDLIVKNATTGKKRGLYGVDWDRSTEYEFFELPVISRDQKRIAYANYIYGGERDISRIGIDVISGGRRETLWEDSEAGVFWARDWSPDGTKLLVSVVAQDRSVSLVQFDLKTRKPEQLVTLGRDVPSPSRAEYSPDGRFVVYDSAKDGESKIYLVSLDGRQERIVVDTPGEDDSPLWSPDGRFLIFRSNRSGEWDLLGIAIEEGRATGEPFLIKANIGESTWLRGITADGRLFYGERLDGPEIVLRERAGAKLGPSRTLPKVKTRIVRAPAFAPDGKRLAYVSGGMNSRASEPTVRIATLDGKILKEIPLGRELRFGGRVSFCPDGLKLAVAAHDRKRQNVIVLFSSETGARSRTLAFEPESRFFISGWSPDGRRMYVVVDSNSGRESRLETIDVETGEKSTSPFPAPHDGTSARVSPDGRFLTIKLLFPSTAPGQKITSRLILRSLADGSERDLTTELVSFVKWDSDSRHLFYRRGSDVKQLWRMSIETGAKELLWNDASNHILASVSLDGRHLAFQKQGGDWRIWVVENFLPAKPAAPGTLRSSR